MRGLRESLRLLARSNALMGALSPAAVSGGGALAAAAPASQAAGLLQREAAALRRWLHCGSGPAAWQQQLVRQQQQWLARQPGAAAELQCLRRLSGGPRRAKDVMEGMAHKNKNSGWYYVSSEGVVAQQGRLRAAGCTRWGQLRMAPVMPSSACVECCCWRHPRQHLFRPRSTCRPSTLTRRPPPPPRLLPAARHRSGHGGPDLRGGAHVSHVLPGACLAPGAPQAAHAVRLACT